MTINLLNTKLHLNTALKKPFLLGTLLLALLVPIKNSFADDVSSQSFAGKWCGKWDNIYTLCLTIQNIDNGSKAQYQWLEFSKGKLKNSEKKIERINRNTLKIDNIWFVLHEATPTQAMAMGVFKRQTRIASLSKE